MLFSSITFLYVFLPLVLLFYFAAPAKFKNYILLVASIFFYFCGEPVYTFLLIFSAVWNYICSLYIAGHGRSSGKGMLIICLAVNIGILAFFKYADFFMEDIPLPIGISFFTFQTMSYTIDVYRRDVEPERNLASFSTYVTLFPQLIAGPIVRYSDVAAEMHNRKIRLENVAYGVRRFVMGLAKKVLIANVVGEVCVAYGAAAEKSVLFAWLYLLGFTFQIYFDFSGYSDMAIGLGKMFGFNFPENFNYPYISKSITDFWRRWHMTLGGWFRDYVYIPLGGNRKGTGRWIFNMAVVWVLTGLWHGAYFNFVMWGVMYGVLLAVEKLWLGNKLEKLPSAFGHIYTLFFVLAGFVVFNGTSMAGIGQDFMNLTGISGVPLVNGISLYYLKHYLVIFIIAAIGSTPIVKRIAEKASENKFLAWLEPVVIVLLLIAVTAYLIDGSFNPFLYFRF